MTNERETTPPPGFSTLPHIPNINTTERPHVTTTVFAATTPGNTSFAYRASTSTDPAPMISPAFVEANYEILESLLRDRRRIEAELKEFLGNGPSKAGAEETKRLGEMNLPSLLVAHLGRNEDGQPSRSSLTSLRLVIPPLGEPLPTLHNEGTFPKLSQTILLEYGGIVKRQFTTYNKEKARVSELSPLDLPSTYKGLMEKTYTCIEAREVTTNRAPNDRMDNFERSRNPLGTSIGDKEVETGYPLTGDLITDCSPACVKVQERSSLIAVLYT
ncbi:hypothetical protein Tco_0459496 [Tanacetum coccineum]